ncbi:Hypothetical predicted protein [Olea europaea subsp. europaea]|uniref:DUF4408 domain-containing protein n=1 Tax=Olea europaea subsp. europaea TaxID=158383 RepID=A0A8S0RK01_OLEEU|nr:Hypothetical predicted protein [Olea europaea subsp. europaea]
MDSEVVFDNVKFEKAKAIARFNRFRKITKIWQMFLVFALVSWSSTRVPAALRISRRFVLEISSYLLNHHVVFLIGNVIIIVLFVLCRQNDAGTVTGTGDFYDDYMKHSEASKRSSSVSERERTTPPVMADAAAVEVGGGDEEKQIIVSPESMENDDMTVAIENASRQVKKFQRTQSEKLKREIAVKPRRELRRSDTEKCRAIVNSGEREITGTTSFDGDEIDTLSSEDFQRTVDAFIQKHWIKKLPN